MSEDAIDVALWERGTRAFAALRDARSHEEAGAAFADGWALFSLVLEDTMRAIRSGALGDHDLDAAWRAIGWAEHGRRVIEAAWLERARPLVEPVTH